VRTPADSVRPSAAGVLGASVASNPSISDTIRIGVVFGWIVWSTAFAFWRDLASPELFGAAGISIYPTDLLIAGTFVYGVLDLLDILLGGRSSRIEQAIALLIGGYATYTLCVVWPVAVLGGLSPAQSIRAVASRFMVLLVPLAMGLLRRRPQLEETLLTAPAFMAIPLVLGGAFNAATRSFVVSAEEGYTRIRLLWGGSALIFAWPILVGLVHQRTARSRSAIILAVTGVIGVLMANHRTAFVTLAVVLPMLFRPRNKMAKRLLVVLLVGFVFALLLLAVASLSPGEAFGYSAARLLDFTAGNGADRLMRWRLAAATFWARPFNDIAWTDQWYLVDLARDYGPHNWVLEVLVSEGVMGFAFYIGVFIQAFRYSRRWSRYDGIVTGLSTYIVFFLLFCAFNGNFYSLANQPFLWLAIGMLSHRGETLAGITDAEGPSPTLAVY